jgi:hypothetical protein
MIYCFEGRLCNNHRYYRNPKQILRDKNFITISIQLHDCSYNLQTREKQKTEKATEKSKQKKPEKCP